MVPHPTAQYGQVERVSLARAILSVRNCAYAGFKSRPNTAAAAPPIAVSLKKSRRVGFMLGLPSTRSKVREGAPRGIYLIKIVCPDFNRGFSENRRGSHGSNSQCPSTTCRAPTQ